jgi:dTDP-glucose 4,6-dehydratase
MQSSEQDTSQELAEGTGGQVCTGDNDLGDCIRKAVNDSSDYYEIAYYPDSPDWNGEYRKVSESLVMAYHRFRGVNTHLVRIFNTYGPRLHPSDGRVISNFMMQALRGEPLTIYGGGTQTRSFCYVDDLIDGIVLLSRSGEHYPVNIGNPVEFTILECAKAVLEVTGSSSELCFEPLPEDDPTLRCPDISKARRLLNWDPRINLREGLQKSMAFFKSKRAVNA